jgi:hypothetical protein
MKRHTFLVLFMVKKKAAPKTRISRKETAGKVPVRTDMSSVEDETIKRTGRTISAIENFLAKWDAAKIKPDDMFPQIVKIRQFHDALVSWQKDAVRFKAKADDEGRVKRLRDLVLICRTYS